jgi:hypothetical protein
MSARKLRKADAIEIANYESISDAARSVTPTGGDVKKYIHGIQLAITGAQDTAWKHRWEYVDNDKRGKADAVRMGRPSNKKAVVKHFVATGEVIEEYNSLEDAAIANGFTASSVSKHVRGKVLGDAEISYRLK